MKYIKFVVIGVLLCGVFAQIQPQNPLVTTTGAVLHVEQVSAAPAQEPSYRPCVDHMDICDALQRAGFQGEQLHIMAAIGHAESSMRADARGDVSLMDAKWEASYGAFQIRCLQNPGNQWWRDKNFVTASLDNQAKAAWVISGQGKNFGPWSTFNDKDWKGRPQVPPYLQHM